jgi:hypothetical protein
LRSNVRIQSGGTAPFTALERRQRLHTLQKLGLELESHHGKELSVSDKALSRHLILWATKPISSGDQVYQTHLSL